MDGGLIYDILASQACNINLHIVSEKCLQQRDSGAMLAKHDVWTRYAMTTLVNDLRSSAWGALGIVKQDERYCRDVVLAVRAQRDQRTYTSVLLLASESQSNHT